VLQFAVSDVTTGAAPAFLSLTCGLPAGVVTGSPTACTLHGAPPLDGRGTFALAITATDSAGASAASVFMLRVGPPTTYRLDSGSWR
jgi:hypothetical protein